MAIRIAEYALIVARQLAVWDIEKAIIPMPQFSVIYIKRTDKTPSATTIIFTFPDGQKVEYKSDNVILEEMTREYIIQRRLFPYIPFYIARYEKEIVSGEGTDKAEEDLTYFRDGMLQLYQAGELSDGELVDLMGFVNTIITHITNGSKIEERLVGIMGGTVIETQTEKWIKQGVRQGIRQGQAQMIVEIGQEDGLDDATILKRLQEKLGLTLEDAKVCLAEYGKQFA